MLSQKQQTKKKKIIIKVLFGINFIASSFCASEPRHLLDFMPKKKDEQTKQQRRKKK